MADTLFKNEPSSNQKPVISERKQQAVIKASCLCFPSEISLLIDKSVILSEIYLPGVRKGRRRNKASFMSSTLSCKRDICNPLAIRGSVYKANGCKAEPDSFILLPCSPCRLHNMQTHACSLTRARAQNTQTRTGQRCTGGGFQAQMWFFISHTHPKCSHRPLGWGGVKAARDL